MALSLRYETGKGSTTNKTKRYIIHFARLTSNRRVRWLCNLNFWENVPNYSWNIGGNVCEMNPFIYDKWYGPIYQRLCKNPTANLHKVSSSSAFVPLKVVRDHPAGREDLMFRSKPFCNRFVAGLADWGSCVRGINVLVWLVSGYKTGYPLLFLLVHVGHCSLHTSVCLH